MSGARFDNGDRRNNVKPSNMRFLFFQVWIDFYLLLPLPHTTRKGIDFDRYFD